MKHSIRLALAVLILGSATAWAANPAITPVNKPGVHPTPIHPRVHQIAERLMNQWRLTAVGVKSGKITQQQATEIRASLKTIHQQQVSDFKASSNHELTADQQNELNSELDKNSQVLGEPPTPTN